MNSLPPEIKSTENTYCIKCLPQDLEYLMKEYAEYRINLFHKQFNCKLWSWETPVCILIANLA